MSADVNPPPRTRGTDHPDVAARIKAARNEGRKRTLMLSVIMAGIVSLFVGNAFETQAFNDQADRSRENCEINQKGIRLTVGEYDRRGDVVLGDKKEKIPAFDFKGTSFEEFEPLLVAQAKGYRQTAGLFRELLINCNTTFPKRSYIPFIN